MEKVNLSEKLNSFDEYWNPKIVGELNGQLVKLAKLKGEFIWHHHDVEDELFYAIKGSLLLKLEDQDIVLQEGEFFIVPHGVRHKPMAEEEVHVFLFEPSATINTGDIQNAMTIDHLESI
jgi:quercetin dioxygenase-like cupin family protein